MPATAVDPSSGGSTSLMVPSDVQETNVVGVRRDEVLAELDVVAHEDRHHFVGERRLLDVDLQEGALGRIHRGGAEFLPVHLTETLQTGELELLRLVLGEER